MVRLEQVRHERISWLQSSGVTVADGRRGCGGMFGSVVSVDAVFRGRVSGAGKGGVFFETQRHRGAQRKGWMMIGETCDEGGLPVRWAEGRCKGRAGFPVDA
jgi:hypothetical protein